MSLLIFPTITDDSGGGQDGTIIDAALFSSIKSAIEAVTHSATNPTVDPNDITDEVVTARGNLASLNARLSGVIDADGNLVVGASLVTVSILEENMGGPNLARNAKLNDWSGGTSAAPDEFSLSGAGAAIARTGIGEPDTTRKVGKYAAKVTFGTATAKLTQANVAAADWNDWDFLEGNKVSLGVWVLTTVVSKVRVFIDDGASVSYSPYHAGDGAWSLMTVNHTVSGAATKLDFGVQIEGAGNFYCSGFTFTATDNAPSRFVPSPAPKAQFLTLTPSAELENERVITPGAGIRGSDNGAGAAYDIEQDYDSSKGVVVVDEFLDEAASSTTTSLDNIPALGWRFLATPSNGLFSRTASEAEHPGVVNVQTGTLAGDKAALILSIWGEYVERMVWIVKETIGTAHKKIGFWDASAWSDRTRSTTTGQGVFFHYVNGVDTNWQCVTSDGTSTTVSDGGVAGSTTSWIKFELRKISTGWEFYINGVLRATITTTVPTMNLDSRVVIILEAETSAARAFLVDYFGMKLDYSGLTNRWT